MSWQSCGLFLQLLVVWTKVCWRLLLTGVKISFHCSFISTYHTTDRMWYIALNPRLDVRLSLHYLTSRVLTSVVRSLLYFGLKFDPQFCYYPVLSLLTLMLFQIWTCWYLNESSLAHVVTVLYAQEEGVYSSKLVVTYYYMTRSYEHNKLSRLKTRLSRLVTDSLA